MKSSTRWPSHNKSESSSKMLVSPKISATNTKHSWLWNMEKVHLFHYLPNWIQTSRSTSPTQIGCFCSMMWFPSLPISISKQCWLTQIKLYGPKMSNSFLMCLDHPQTRWTTNRGPNGSRYNGKETQGRDMDRPRNRPSTVRTSPQVS